MRHFSHLPDFALTAHRASSIAATTAVIFCVSTWVVHAVEMPRLVSPEKTSWSLKSIFKKDAKKDPLEDQARMNLSGAACAATAPKFKACLIANDEKRYVQFFSIDGTALSPGDLMRISDAGKDPDAEGVAYDDGYFYITGSHGRTRHSDKTNETSYAVFRVPVSQETGMPKFKLSDDEKAKEIEASDRLRGVLLNHPVLNAAYDRALDRGGLNIEGVAVRNSRMHFGLRAPSGNQSAYIASVDAKAMFSESDDLKSKVTALKLGDNTGIRDLTAIEDGILILAGPTRDEAVPYTIWQWDGNGDSAKPLATLDLSGIDRGAKAEILLPLSVDTSRIRVLVMFDGLENGGPRSFEIQR